MTSKTKRSLFLGSALVAGVAMAVWSPVQAQSADSTEAVVLTDAQMAKCCQDVTDLKAKCRDESKAQNTLLTEHVAAMNSATQEKKLAEAVSVITLMAQQRITTDTRRASMEGAMLKHMMQHAQIGKDSMPTCPMMKGLDEKPAEAKWRDEPPARGVRLRAPVFRGA